MIGEANMYRRRMFPGCCVGNYPFLDGVGTFSGKGVALCDWPQACTPKSKRIQKPIRGRGDMSNLLIESRPLLKNNLHDLERAAVSHKWRAPVIGVGSN